MTHASTTDDRAGPRLEVLRRFGATRDEATELLRYNRNPFSIPRASDLTLPLPDEPFVAAWEGYARDATRLGAVAVLRGVLPQLRFPVAAGMGESPDYLAATRRGVLPAADSTFLEFEAPERVQIFLHATPAGRIPGILLEHRPDFVAVLRAILARNEPATVLDSQGASMVAGYNNWDRMARLRDAFERGQLADIEASTWGEAFRQIRARPELYQDRFIILSDGPYSGVSAAELRLADEEWRRLSLAIRLEHECAHYFTKRVFGAMGKSLVDELIADYAGVVAATGTFSASWLLRFLGVDANGFRDGGRLANYRGTPPLSDGAFSVLQALVRRAAQTLETADRTTAGSVASADRRVAMIGALAEFTLEELAVEGAEAPLARRLISWHRHCRQSQIPGPRPPVGAASSLVGTATDVPT